jgi:hypothetical protein
MPLPLRGRSNRPLVIGAAVVGVVAVVIGLGAVFLNRSSDTESAGGVAATTLPAPKKVGASEGEKRLLALLPGGYPSGACTPTRTTAANAEAAMTCPRNGDAGGPSTATYTLLKDQAALDAAFRQVVQASTTVECPGRIQSPGPWRRNAASPQVNGILFCGIQHNRPAVAWTNDEDLLLSTVQGDAQGPSLAQLYAWWSLHS